MRTIVALSFISAFIACAICAPANASPSGASSDPAAQATGEAAVPAPAAQPQSTPDAMGTESAADLAARVEQAFTASHSLTYEADCDIVVFGLGSQGPDFHYHVRAEWESNAKPATCRVDVTQGSKVVRIIALDNGSGYDYDAGTNRFRPIKIDANGQTAVSFYSPALVTILGGLMWNCNELGSMSQSIGDDMWRYAPKTDPHLETVTLCNGPNTIKDNPRVTLASDGKTCILPIMSDVATVDRRTLAVKSLVEDFDVFDVTTPSKPSVPWGFRGTETFTSWQLDAKTDPGEFAWTPPAGANLDPTLDTQLDPRSKITTKH